MAHAAAAGGALPKRKRMLALKIDELSAVDRPAQEGARALLLKRDGAAAQVGKRGVLTKPGGTEQTGQHQHLVYVNEDVQAGSTGYEQSHSHPFVVHEDGTVELGLAMGHTHEVAPYSKVAEHQETTVMAEKTKEVTDLEAALAKSASDLAVATALLALSDGERAYHQALKSDAEKATFLAKSADERKSLVDAALAEAKKAATDANPIVHKTKSGMVIRKNDGDLVLALAKQADEQADELAKARAANEDSTYAKRAADEAGSLPGDVRVRAALLKAVDGIKDEEVRKGALAAVVAGNKAMKAAFKSVGSSDAGSSMAPSEDPELDGTSKAQAETKLDELAKAYAKKNSVTFTKAYSAVLDTEEGQELYAKTSV